jgi:hypothetical protein
MDSKMDVYRPFGAVAPTLVDVPCNYVPALYGGEQVDVGPNDLDWDAWVDVKHDVDVRDGISRSLGSNNWNYADGDELRIKNAAGVVMVSYVVVFAFLRWHGKAACHKRCYLRRHAVVWPQLHS